MTGDFFGLGDDDYYYLPYNVSSMVDVLETKNISWASYRKALVFLTRRPLTSCRGEHAN